MKDIISSRKPRWIVRGEKNGSRVRLVIGVCEAAPSRFRTLIYEDTALLSMFDIAELIVRKFQMKITEKKQLTQIIYICDLF